MRSVDDALADVRAKERELREEHLNLLPVTTPEQWRALGDRCVIDAILPATCEQRYAYSIDLAAYCYEQARRMS
jgi:hypothetical protein